MNRIRDLTNQRFGSLTAIEYIRGYKTSRKIYWVCLCDCGRICIVRGRDLIVGHTKSCGCFKLNRKDKLYNNTHYSKHIIALYLSYKRGAVRRNIEFDIQLLLFEKMIKSSCYYCDCDPSTKYKYTDLYYNGIDRLDNDKGYIESNVVTCCKTCNYAKKDMSRDEFLSWIERVYKHNFKESK